MQMSQCKPRVSKKDGIVHIKNKPRYVPLPEWLAIDLRNYLQFRMMIGWYVGEGLEDFRLFPRLGRTSLIEWLCKLRDRYKDRKEEVKWLFELWQITKGYDENGNLLWTKKKYRIAPHGCRSNYVTCSYEATNKDIMATKVLSGHSETKDVERYIKVSGIMEKKIEVKERFMDNLMPMQRIPLLVGQKKLTEIFK